MNDLFYHTEISVELWKACRIASRVFFFYLFLTLKQGRAVWSVFNKIQIKKIKDIDPPYLDIFFQTPALIV